MKYSHKIVEAIISEVVGEDVLPLVEYLKNKTNISEFKIAEAIKKEINETRNMLYRLHEVNLVSFTRKKDKQKGWYIYYWTFRPEMIKHLIISNKKKKLEKLKERLEREKSSHFFICPNNCLRVDFEQAMNFEFKCPECGEIMQQDNNKDKIEEIKKEILELENALLSK